MTKFQQKNRRCSRDSTRHFFKKFKQPEINNRLGTWKALCLIFVLSLCQFFMSRSRMFPHRKVPFRMLSKSTKSGKIKHLKLICYKLRIQIAIVLNTNNTMSDLGNIACFSTTRTALEPLLISSLTCDSKVNNIEFLKVLPSANNSEYDVQLMPLACLRSELDSSDGGCYFFFL